MLHQVPAAACKKAFKSIESEPKHSILGPKRTKNLNRAAETFDWFLSHYK